MRHGTGAERAVIASLSTGAEYQFELARLAPEQVARRRVHRARVPLRPVPPDTPHGSAKSPISLPPRFTHPRARLVDAHEHRFTGGRNSSSGSPTGPSRAMLPRAPLGQGHRGRRRMDALDRSPETLTATVGHCGWPVRGRRTPCASWRGTSTARCFVVQKGDHDKIVAPRDGRALALAPRRKSWWWIRGSGHLLHAPQHHRFDLALRDFAEDAFGRERAPRKPARLSPRQEPSPGACLSPHRSASVTRSAMWRSPGRIHGVPLRTCRILQLPQDQVTPGAERPRASASIPRTTLIGRRLQAHTNRSQPSTTCAPSTQYAVWMRSSPRTL